MHITSLGNVPSPVPSESSPYWFQGNFAAMFVLNYWLREFPLSVFTNRFELSCEPKQLMLLYYKIFPCLSDRFQSGEAPKVIEHVSYAVRCYKILLVTYSESIALQTPGPYDLRGTGERYFKI